MFRFVTASVCNPLRCVVAIALVTLVSDARAQTTYNTATVASGTYAWTTGATWNPVAPSGGPTGSDVIAISGDIGAANANDVVINYASGVSGTVSIANIGVTDTATGSNARVYFRAGVAGSALQFSTTTPTVTTNLTNVSASAARVEIDAPLFQASSTFTKGGNGNVGLIFNTAASGSSFSNNVTAISGSTGGVLYLSNGSGSAIPLPNVTFNSGTATQLYLGGGTFTASGRSITTGTANAALFGGAVLTLQNSSTFTGGTLYLSAAGSGFFYVGGNATMNVIDSTVNVSNLWMGEQTSATSVYNQQSGTTTISTGGFMGNPTAASTITTSATVSGGLMQFTNAAQNDFRIGNVINRGGSPTGSATVNATFTISGTGIVDLGTATRFQLAADTSTAADNVNGTLNLNGGLLKTAREISRGSNTSSLGTDSARVFLNSGTIQTTAAIANLFTSFTGTSDGIFVSAGGAVIDTNGFSSGITANLLQTSTSTGGGLTKLNSGTLTLSGTNTFTGDTLVSGGTLALGSNLALQNSPLDTSGAGRVVLNSGVTAPTFGGLKGSTDLATEIASGYGSVTALTLNVGSGTTATYSGVIANGTSTGMTLTKTGSGTQVLSGSNAYSGGTTISSGSLRLGNASALGATTGSLSVNGGTLDLNGNPVNVGTLSGSSGATITTNSVSGTATLTTTYTGGTTTYGGAIVDNGSGRMALVTTGTGRLNLSGSSAYAGGTQILGMSQIAITNSSALGSGTITLSSTASSLLYNLIINTGSLSVANPIVISATSGRQAIQLNNSGTASLTGPIVFSGSNASNQQIVESRGALTLSGGISGPTGALSLRGVNGGSVLLSGTVNLGGSSNVDINGGGLVRVTSTGNVWASTTLVSGTLQLGASDALATGARVTVNTSATTSVLDLAGFNQTVAGLNYASAATGPITIVNNGTAGSASTLTLAGLGQSNTFLGALADGTAGGTLALVMNSSGRVQTLSGSSSYSGGTTITSGTLQVGNGAALGVPAGSLTVNGGGLDLNGNAVTVGLLTGAGAGTITTTAGTATLTAGSATSGTFAGTITGTLGLAKQGIGTLSLTGTNTFTQGVSIGANAGTIAANLYSGTGSSALGSGTASVGAGSQLLLVNTSTTNTGVTVSNPLTGSGMVQLGFAAGTTARSTFLTGLSGFTGTVVLSATAGATGDKLNTTPGYGTLNAALVVQPGTTFLAANSSTSSFTNGITVSGTGNSEGLGALRFGSNATLGGPVSLAADATIAASGASAVLAGDISTTGTTTLTFGTPGATQGATFSGNIGDGTGRLALVKTQSGTLTLTGTNTYSGTTTVSGGRLVGTTSSLQGAITNNATVEFAQATGGTYSGSMGGSGALTQTGPGTLTLAGANTYGGSTTVGGGTLALGASQGLAGVLVLGGSAGATTVGAVDLTAASGTFGGLTVQTFTSATNRITVGAGRTLATNGNVVIGGVPATGTSSTNLAVTGATVGVGTWTIGNAQTSGTFQVGMSSATAGDSAFVDLAGLGVFTANLTGTSSVFRVGSTSTLSTTAVSATMALAATSTVTAKTLAIGDVSGQGTMQALLLGSDVQRLNADALIVGASGGVSIRSGGLVQFTGASGSLVLRDQGGTGRANVTMISGGLNTGSLPTSTIDVRGHDADLLIGTLAMTTLTGNAGNAYASTFSFDQGTLDVTALTMGSKSSTAAGTATNTATVNLGSSTNAAVNSSTIGSISMASHSGTSSTINAVLNVAGANTVVTVTGSWLVASNAAASGVGASGGTVNVSGGTVNANQGIVLRSGNGFGTVNGTLAITGGVLTSGGNITSAGTFGGGTSTLSVNGGRLDMGGFAIGGAGQTITTTLQSGTLSNLGELNAGGPLTKTSAGTLTLGGSNTYTGDTLVNAGTLALGAGGAVASSPLIRVASGATYDVSAVTGYTLAAGQTLKGNGTVVGDMLAGAGSTIAPGSSTGLLTQTGAATLASSGTFQFEINDVTGTAGSTSLGWDLFNVGSLLVTASSASPYRVNIISLGSNQLPGEALNWDDATGYAWKFIDAGAAITTFSSAAFEIDASAFQNAHQSGGFGIARGDDPFVTALVAGANDTELYIIYAAVPEPTTIALAGLGLGVVGLVQWRRSRKAR